MKKWTRNRLVRTRRWSSRKSNNWGHRMPNSRFELKTLPLLRQLRFGRFSVNCWRHLYLTTLPGGRTETSKPGHVPNPLFRHRTTLFCCHKYLIHARIQAAREHCAGQAGSARLSHAPEFGHHAGPRHHWHPHRQVRPLSSSGGLPKGRLAFPSAPGRPVAIGYESSCFPDDRLLWFGRFLFIDGIFCRSALRFFYWFRVGEHLGHGHVEVANVTRSPVKSPDGRCRHRCQSHQ